ncbi:hypothetical protein IFT84_00770 [Rhizobium sp. CFBP 8762]|uniref:hypothetical protein n=1 Tax=Rhizobium sp. CFBP 8762 TaxID=2775279 RepID=UPI00177FF88A|nr:hypothetical protein [Rhizobium sp. CFBP 8762]MBD8553050.1 hypothetical protein [Rhizobium sp. CFBP 8762]
MRISQEFSILRGLTVSPKSTKSEVDELRFKLEVHQTTMSEKITLGISRHIKAPDDWEPYRVTHSAVLQQFALIDKPMIEASIADMQSVKNNYAVGLQRVIDDYQAIIAAEPSQQVQLQQRIDGHRNDIAKSDANWDLQIAEFKSQWSSLLGTK